jgi:hypothetical protein
MRRWRRVAIRCGTARLRSSPTAADGELAVPEGKLLQHLEQVDVDATGRRVLYLLKWHVPSEIESRVYRRGPGTAD